MEGIAREKREKGFPLGAVDRDGTILFFTATDCEFKILDQEWDASNLKIQYQKSSAIRVFPFYGTNFTIKSI